MESSPRRLVGLGIALALALSLLALWLRPEPPVVLPVADGHLGHDHSPPHRTAPAPPEASSPSAAEGATPDEIRALTEEAIARGDSLSDGLDLPRPAVTDLQVAMPPRAEPLGEEELLDQRIEAIGSIDRTLDRLEAELEATGAAGEEEQARRLGLRIARLKETRDERVAEVEAAMGEVP